MFRRALAFTLLLSATTAVTASDLSLEPCINGGVSATGSFPTQEMEDQINAYLDWRSEEPYYLFRMAADRVETPYEEQ